MSDRIIVGRYTTTQLGEKSLLRISPPGQDATDLSAPAVFCSENDYMRVHQRSSGIGDPVTQIVEGGSGVYYYYAAYATFPALSYIPLVWWGITIGESGGVSNRIFYPYDNQATSEYPSSAWVMVSQSAIWLWIRGLYIPQTFRFRYIVFENEM